jgi:hypothetical protein
MHRGGGTTTGRRGRLKTTTLRWRVAPAVVGGLRGRGSGTATRAKERGEGRWRRGRSGRVTGVREKNPAGDGGGALSNLAMRGGNGGGGGSGSGSATRHKADVGSGPDRRAARGQGREPVSWPRGGGETGVRSTSGRRSAGSGPRPASAGGVARPCRAVGWTGEGERGWPMGHSHSAGRRHWLTGGPERHSAVRRGFKRDSKYFKQIQNSPNFDWSKRYLPLLQKSEIKYGWKELEMRNNFA